MSDTVSMERLYEIAARQNVTYTPNAALLARATLRAMFSVQASRFLRNEKLHSRGGWRFSAQNISADCRRMPMVGLQDQLRPRLPLFFGHDPRLRCGDGALTGRIETRWRNGLARGAVYADENEGGNRWIVHHRHCGNPRC